MPRHVFPALLLVLSLGAAPASGAGALSPTEACLADATTDSERAACIGETARACQSGFATPVPLDIAICINTETEWWQARLPEALERMAAQAERLDAAHQGEIAKGAPRLTDDVEALQASWKDWTEKRCTFEAMLLRGDPRRMIVAADCMLQQVATQTLLLERGAGEDR